MSDSYELARLDASSFEDMVNLLALRVLGPGHTGFSPGPDGGRDGYFEGEAPYPSESEHWTGRWYIQSKFHKPHLSTNAQKWLLERIEEEIAEFQKSNTKRVWPDNWIIVTNIDPSGPPTTGSFDKARKLVASARPQLNGHFHIWGGQKVLHFLALNPDVAKQYAHVMPPGHIVTKMLEQITGAGLAPGELLSKSFLNKKQILNSLRTRLEADFYTSGLQSGQFGQTRISTESHLYRPQPTSANEPREPIPKYYTTYWGWRTVPRLLRTPPAGWKETALDSLKGKFEGRRWVGADYESYAGGPTKKDPTY